MCCCLVVEPVCSHSCWTIFHNNVGVCVCGCVCEREREREKVSVCLCVCACVCGGDKERGRKDSMGEQDVATDTGEGGLVSVIKA